MTLFNRVTHCLLHAFFLAVIPLASHAATFNPQVVAQGGNEQAINDSCDRGKSSNPGSLYGVVTDSSSGQFTCVRCWTGHGSFNGTHPYGFCSDEPLPGPECTIPEGTHSDLTSTNAPLGASTCYQNCTHSTQSKNPPWMQSGSLRIYYYDAESTGEFCDEPTTAQPGGPPKKEEFPDKCFEIPSGTYCEAQDDYDCPNSYMYEGQKFCRENPDSPTSPCNETGGQSGDDYCGQDDPHYDDPLSGDDGSDGGDGSGDGGDGSGDGSGDGGDGSGDGDGGSGDGECDPEAESCEEGGYEGGVCTSTERTEPKCYSKLDIIQCGIFLNNWNLRCDTKLNLTEVYGDGDDIKAATKAGDSVLGDHENNDIPSDEIDFAGLVDDALDPGLITINSQCPAPLKFTFYGKSYELSWEPMCTVAEGVHPFVVTLGYVAAAFIMIKRIKK